MEKDYDETIKHHYDAVAEEHGLSSSSTMADSLIRKIETDAIVAFVENCIKLRKLENLCQPATIADVGCGNGLTLEVLFNKFPDQKFVGIEKVDSLKSLAESRFNDNGNVKIISGDIRDKSFIQNNSVDILLCQRVIINLLDRADQTIALDNIIETVTSSVSGKGGGKFFFLEAFEDPLINLNMARSEFELSPIPPAYHNLYLPKNFFERPDIKVFMNDNLPPNLLSTHYYITRVLHALFTQGKPFKRNSEFVQFFSQALNPFVGDYAPLKLHMFEKI